MSSYSRIRNINNPIYPLHCTIHARSHTFTNFNYLLLLLNVNKKTPTFKLSHCFVYTYIHMYIVIFCIFYHYTFFYLPLSCTVLKSNSYNRKPVGTQRCIHCYAAIIRNNTQQHGKYCSEAELPRWEQWCKHNIRMYGRLCLVWAKQRYLRMKFNNMLISKESNKQTRVKHEA